jgi:hypothetical protein
MVYETKKTFEIYEISSIRNVVNTLPAGCLCAAPPADQQCLQAGQIPEKFKNFDNFCISTPSKTVLEAV